MALSHGRSPLYTRNDGAERCLEPRMVSVELDEEATRAAVVAVTNAIHYAADALVHVGSPWGDATPEDLGRIGVEAQRIARLSGFGERLGWNGGGGTFTGTEGELLDLAVLLRSFADGAMSASRHVAEPAAAEDRTLSEAAARASRLLAGYTGPEETA